MHFKRENEMERQDYPCFSTSIKEASLFITARVILTQRIPAKGKRSFRWMPLPNLLRSKNRARCNRVLVASSLIPRQTEVSKVLSPSTFLRTKTALYFMGNVQIAFSTS